MMYLLAGGTTVVLPNALPQDRESNLVSMVHRRSMNNVAYSYVRNQGRLRLTYKFSLFRGKALELQAFVNAYLTYPVTVYDYKGNVYITNFVEDPFEYVHVARDEITEVTVIFEGVKIGSIHYAVLTDELSPTDSAVVGLAVVANDNVTSSEVASRVIDADRIGSDHVTSSENMVTGVT